MKKTTRERGWFSKLNAFNNARNLHKAESLKGRSIVIRSFFGLRRNVPGVLPERIAVILSGRFYGGYTRTERI